MSALEQSKFPQSVKWSSWNLSTLWKLALNMLASHQSHPVKRSNRAFLSLARFWCARQSLCMNRVKSLLRMCCMLPGYSFESRSDLIAVRLVQRAQFWSSVYQGKTSLTRENKIDLSKSSGLWRFQRFSIHVIQAWTPFVLLSQENKRRFSQGASERPFNNSLLTIEY